MFINFIIKFILLYMYTLQNDISNTLSPLIYSYTQHTYKPHTIIYIFTHKRFQLQQLIIQQHSLITINIPHLFQLIRTTRSLTGTPITIFPHHDTIHSNMTQHRLTRRKTPQHRPPAILVCSHQFTLTWKLVKLANAPLDGHSTELSSSTKTTMFEVPQCAFCGPF